MAKLVWDAVGEREYETGVDHGVLYLQDTAGNYATGFVWNGLTAVNETPSGAESNPQYADNIKYIDITSAEGFGATIEAFTYPDEFAVCDGTAVPTPGVYFGQQGRKPFGFSYRTLLGNDLEGTEYGYKLHFIYGAKAAPSEKSRSTVNESPEPTAFSWEVTTTGVSVDGYKPLAQLSIDSTEVDPAKLAALEAIVYGTDEVEARLPLPSEILTLMKTTP